MSNLPFDRSTIEFGRSVSFFDAIYGFAITLLVTNIDLPPAGSWTSITTLWNSHFPGQLLGFVLSFVVIAIFWRVNFRFIGSMALMSPRLITWNIVAAFFVILIPFTTQGTSDPGTADLRLPTALYALNIALASLSQTAIYLSARKHGLTQAETDKGKRHLGQLLLFLHVPAVFLASIPVTLLAGAVPGRLVWATLFVISPITGKFVATTVTRVTP
ncbi:TMEM175 family protein [Arthrobacter sp. GCM10027362]|uniref:TMEM175 family protein n=1 Tax=Arthrobacter sp. GCM10027362 TaxID=3273379 RepID=UPI00362D54A7